MNRFYTYCFLLVIVLLSSCEEIYNPDVDDAEGTITVEAQIILGEEDNYVRLRKSIGFNEKTDRYPVIEGARVIIQENNGTEHLLPEEIPGNFRVNFSFDRNMEYKLIIDYDGNTYESIYESIKEIPEIDTVYGEREVKAIVDGATNSGDVRKEVGVRTYCDITNSENHSTPYYRFSAKKILQNMWIEAPGTDFELYHYVWRTVLPSEKFNVAGPVEYSNSNSIDKHQLFFLAKNAILASGNNFEGWILLLKQYAISEAAYKYYKDLNSQLDSEGRLFDPLYVQARSNIKCTSDPGELIFGNFEISTPKEYRYFVRFISNDLGYKIKKIDHFYEIPEEGETTEFPPEFWEH